MFFQIWRSISWCNYFPCRKIEIKRIAKKKIDYFLHIDIIMNFSKLKVGPNILPMSRVSHNYSLQLLILFLCCERCLQRYEISHYALQTWGGKGLLHLLRLNQGSIERLTGGQSQGREYVFCDPGEAYWFLKLAMPLLTNKFLHIV